MQISDNILREQLKNVYFLGGGGYGGKTTMSQLIAKKYGFRLYHQDDCYDAHAKIATPEFQPSMCLDRNKDWHGFFAQPPAQYAQWLWGTTMEDEQFALMDLIHMARDGKVIADVNMMTATLLRVSDPGRVVLLFAPEEMTRSHYFNRPDKEGLKQFILSFPDGEDLLKNVIEALHYRADEIRKSYYDSGFCCIERTGHDTIEGTLQKIERHFGWI